MSTRYGSPTQADNDRYCAFTVGQHVVLVDDNWPARYYASLEKNPVKGVIYTVRYVEVINGEPCIALKEIVNPKLPYRHGIAESVFYARRFRPLQKLTPEMFMSADAPVKQGEPV